MHYILICYILDLRQIEVGFSIKFQIDVCVGEGTFVWDREMGLDEMGQARPHRNMRNIADLKAATNTSTPCVGYPTFPLRTFKQSW